MDIVYRMLVEKQLKGKQHKLDVDKDGKIEGEDLAKLRAQNEEEEISSSDYKTSKSGKKIPAHKIVMHKGEDDKKQIGEKLDPSMGAGEYVKHFKASDAPQFAGKSSEKRRQMAIAAFLAAQREKKNMKEEQIEEVESHQSKTTMKHVMNPTAGEKKAAKDIKPGIAGYRDRIAMLKSAEARGGLKKEEVEQIDEISLGLAKKARDKAEHMVDMDYDDMRDKPYGHSEKQRSKFQRYIDKKEPRAKGDRDWDPPVKKEEVQLILAKYAKE